MTNITRQELAKEWPELAEPWMNKIIDRINGMNTAVLLTYQRGRVYDPRSARKKTIKLINQTFKEDV